MDVKCSYSVHFLIIFEFNKKLAKQNLSLEMDVNLFASIPPPPTFYQVYFIPFPTTQIQTLLPPTPFE